MTHACLLVGWAGLLFFAGEACFFQLNLGCSAMARGSGKVLCCVQSLRAELAVVVSVVHLTGLRARYGCDFNQCAKSPSVTGVLCLQCLVVLWSLRYTGSLTEPHIALMLPAARTGAAVSCLYSGRPAHLCLLAFFTRSPPCAAMGRWSTSNLVFCPVGQILTPR